MKSALIFLSLLTLSLQAIGAEQIDAGADGRRSQGNHRCAIRHLTLPSIPDAALSADFYPTRDEQEEAGISIGSLVINDFNLQDYNTLIFSNTNIATTLKTSNPLSMYPVTVRASTNGQIRTIKLSIAKDSENYHPRELTIIVHQNQIKEMTIIDMKEGFFGNEVVFKDTCVF